VTAHPLDAVDDRDVEETLRALLLGAESFPAVAPDRSLIADPRTPE